MTVSRGIRAIALIVAVMMAGGCSRLGAHGTASPLTSVGPTLSAGAATPTASTLPSVTPVASADLPVVRLLLQGHTIDPSLPWDVAINADGRYAWRPQEGVALVVERMLSPQGISKVRSALEAEVALQTTGTYELEPIPGADPPDHGRSFWIFRVSVGAETVIVQSENQQGLEAFYRVTPEGEGLNVLAARLSDPEAWLPTGAWSGPSRAFEPDAFLIRVVLAPYDADAVSGRAFMDLDVPFDPRTMGEATGAEARCARLSADDVGAFVERLGSTGEQVGLDWPEEGLEVFISAIGLMEPDPSVC